MRKELLLVLKLRVPEQQFREWKRHFRNMRKCLELQGTRFVIFSCHLSLFKIVDLDISFWHNDTYIRLNIPYFCIHISSYNMPIHSQKSNQFMKNCYMFQFANLYRDRSHNGYLQLVILKKAMENGRWNICLRNYFSTSRLLAFPFSFPSLFVFVRDGLNKTSCFVLSWLLSLFYAPCASVGLFSLLS